MNDAEFKNAFKSRTRYEPLSWQMRLFDEHFVKGNGLLPPVIDLPTGIGKTMLMAIWLIAREVNDALPRRLIYVVDRRTVVDQATDVAIMLQKSVGKDQLAVSTLRGQLADNREWSRDPSRAAIIIGTVDLIGSALLFSGYRSGYKTRPLHAGLLGQDSLLVLDEAHLSKPFEKLVTSIVQFQHGQGAPMKVIRMSATSAGEDANHFKLEDSDRNDEIITERFSAKKRLVIEPAVESKNLNDALANAAIKVSIDTAIVGKRIVVFVRSPDDATKIAVMIRKHGSTKGAPGPFAGSVEVLTGTMRGLERDELIEKPILKRFLDGDIHPSDESNQHPVFLISTSAGEVGFDLNADHMVCDLAPLDSMIQRLGRVNRRGKGDARIVLIPEVIKTTDKDGKPRKLSDLEQAIANTLDLLKDQTDVSPSKIDSLKRNDWRDRYADALSPPPTMVELTDILLDAWSMTSITERMPGRPDVAPWLRGVSEWEPPQTTIAWREELDLPGFDQLDMETIEEWFDTHRIRTFETLSVPTSAAAKWFTDRWYKLSDAQKYEVGGRSMIVDRAGLRLITIKELVDELARKSSDSTSTIRNTDLILPASFGGIERHKGLLDADAPQVPKDEEKKTSEERQKAIVARRVAPDVADERGRFRELVTKTEDGDPDTRSIGLGTKPEKSKSSRLVVELESDDDKRVQLVSYVPKYEKPETGSKKQTLAEHVGLVRKHLDEILARLDLPDALKRSAQLAADFHDHGKNRERWQRTVNGVATPPGEKWRDETLGKSGGEMKRDPRGYRHEFGSLREFIDAHKDAKFIDSNGTDITQQVIDLAMHLIAVHHGRGRPHFPKGGFDPDAETRSPEIHTDAIRRFARLQRTYGHWHLSWLENLLRCADALASSEGDNTGGEK